MIEYSIIRLPSDILHQTAQRERKLRRDLKISQVELSHKSGVSLGSIRRFESTGKISFESLLIIAHVLNRLDDFEQLFKRDGSGEIEQLFSERTRS
jgi:transcriptional regulator with XRE-family HTH domain